jgi:hypothetical protein
MRALFYIIGGVLIAFIITIAVFWPTKHNYPSEVTQSFMNSCQASTGGDQKLCADLLDEIQAKYSFEEFELKRMSYMSLLSFQTNSHFIRQKIKEDSLTIEGYFRIFSLLVALTGIILLIYLRLSKKQKSEKRN